MSFFGKTIIVLLCCLSLVNAAPKNLEDEQIDETSVLFAEEPKIVTANRGDTVTFSCDITYDDGRPADDETIISIWLKDSLVQMVGTQKLTMNPRLSLEGRSLVVSDVTLEDAGSYTCQLSTWGQPTLQHRLFVHTAPAIKAEKPRIVATAGDDVVLSCNATGTPVPTVSWKIKDNNAFVGNGDSPLTGKQLTLEQVSHRQAGKYVCVADNGVGEPAKATIELDVMYKPVIKIDKAWIHSGENNQAELTCVIHAQPKPNVVWFRNGVELERDSPHWTQSKADGNTYTLEVKNLKREHFGTYECRASNSIGRSEGMIELSGVAREAVFTSAPNGNLEDSYKLSWTVESYSPITEYLLKYRKVDLNETTGDDAEWNSITVPEQQQPKDAPVSHMHSHDYTLKALEKASEYEVSLQVVNAFGSNKPSTFRFATLGSTVSTWTSGAASMSVCTILTFASLVVLGTLRS